MKKIFFLLLGVSMLLVACDPLKSADEREIKVTPEGFRIVGYFEKGTNNKIGERAFYPNTQQAYIELRFDEQKKNGECYTYYENGNKWSLNTFDHDVLDGDYKTWYESGKIFIDGQYEDGKKSGTWKFYKEDGTLSKEEEYN